MSFFDEKLARREAVLIARGPVGVKIQIVDTDYRLVDKGTVELKRKLPEGVYMVEWTSIGRTEQKVVRLLPISEPLVVSIDEPIKPQSKSREVIAKALSKIEKRSEARLWLRGGDYHLCLFARGRDRS